MNARWRLLLNAGLFQLGWFACVFGASRPGLLLIALGCLVVHLLWVAQAADEWRALLKAGGCGWVLDSVLMQVGVFDFGLASGNAWVLPLWLAVLWLLFASTLRHSLHWIARRWWLGSLLGAIGGPLSYLGGAKLAGVGLPLGLWPSLLLLAVIWAALLPLIQRLVAARRD